ncbi:hypothetical protein [Pseudomonas sp. LT1P18]|uniref:hypothetical protein n=1 Tax=Pseudomonas arabinosi TaxID=3398357 RepID=UPI0039EF4224
MSAQTELAVVPPKETALAVFTAENGLEPWLQKIRSEIDDFNKILPELTTKKGRDAYASMAHKIAKSKTALEAVGKQLSAEQKEVPKKIDAERKRVWDKLELWQKEVRKPLDDWQAAEDARIDAHNQALDRIHAHASDLDGLTSEDLTDRVTKVEAVELGESWQEFQADAALTKDSTLTKLRAALVARQKHEAELAEIARFNAEKSEREQKERDDAIAREAVAKAQREAEEQARLEREAAAKREQALIDQKAEADRALKQADADRIAAQEKAQRDRVEADQRQSAAVEKARLDEIARQEAAADEILRQERLREADKEHKKTICLAAQKALIAGGINEEVAKTVIILIHQRKIPAVSIAY